MYNQSPK